jgi:hypothetical protein
MSFVNRAFCIWFIILSFTFIVAPTIVPLRDGYIGKLRLANFDGIHYLRIASQGYFQFGEAFFPFYPLSIRFFSKFIPLPPEIIGSMISIFSFAGGLRLLYLLVSEEDKNNAKNAVIYLLAFPTSFFFVAVYTEGLFFLLSIGTIYCIKHKMWLIAGILGAIASATRLFGIYLVIFALIEYYREYKNHINIKALFGITLIPLGLLIYVIYLYGRGDAFAFIHVQKQFGANRSDVPIILLPQVIWRYMKIIFTAFLQPSPVSYVISIMEFIFTITSLILVWLYRKTLSVSFIIYTLCILITPTLTGTFSSMPRYILSAFPLFMILAKNINKKEFKFTLITISIILQILAAAFFYQGWFIS